MFDQFIIEGIFSVVSLIGMACVSRHEVRFFGFIICLIGNILWLTLGILTCHTPYLLLFGGYFIFNAIGMHDEYATWRRVREAKQKLIYNRTN